MALTLDQYADHLDGRADLSWPAPPELQGTKSRPHLKTLPGLKAVTWNVYGTLLSVTGGEFYREHPQKFVMDLALDKVIQEFKMWKSMSRKPGQPADQLRTMIDNVTAELSFQVEKGERYPEIPQELIWIGIIKKLEQNEYVINKGFYGSIEEFAVKIAYFFHRSIQGLTAGRGAAEVVAELKSRNLWQGLLADGQAYTAVELQRALVQQDYQCVLDFCIPSSRRVLSHDIRGRKPSERLYKEMARRLRQSGIAPDETLHVSNDLPNDLVYARRYGFQTALYAGDHYSLRAPPEMISDRANRPSILLTDLAQVVELFE
jgi:FMN phosphatase YigB (HAD superfamily)